MRTCQSCKNCSKGEFVNIGQCRLSGYHIGMAVNPLHDWCSEHRYSFRGLYMIALNFVKRKFKNE